MTPDQKPEWFQIADADNAASPQKISKGLPIMGILAAAAIIGVGALVAQPQEQVPANATFTPAANSNQISASPRSIAPANGSKGSERVAPTTSVSDSSVATKAPSTHGVSNPLSKKPKGGEHEEREDNNEGEDD